MVAGDPLGSDPLPPSCGKNTVALVPELLGLLDADMLEAEPLLVGLFVRLEAGPLVSDPLPPRLVGLIEAEVLVADPLGVGLDATVVLVADTLDSVSLGVGLDASEGL